MENQQRITINKTIVLGIFAFCIDMVQVFFDLIVIGLILNRAIDIIVTILFWIIFKTMGVSFTKTRAFVFFGFALLEMFPGMDAFPLWTADVIAVCIMVMAEDRVGILKDLSGTFAKGGAAAAKAAVTEKQKLALKNTTGAIINTLQSTRNMPNSEVTRGASRLRQNYDAELDNRSQIIAAQKEQKQNATEKNLS